MMLQITVALLALVPVSAGIVGVFFYGPAELHDQAISIAEKNHFSYLSGLLIGIGLGFWSCIPNIKKKTERFRILTFIVFVGGLMRLYDIIGVHMPANDMLFGLGMELIITPLLCVWQNKLSRKLF